jgi:8-oxo-dGTP diphosphatase
MTASTRKTPANPYPMPFTRLEVALLGVVDGELHVLLARRAGAPHAGRWALPGGVLRIDLDHSLDEAARRVARERLGIEIPRLRQLTAIGGPTRDPRAPWGLSIVYRALVLAEKLAPVAGKRIEALEWRPAEEAAADAKLAFDHHRLVSLALAELRDEIESLELPDELLPEPFTLGELQFACEAILGHPLDKSSFRRRLADRDLVGPVKGAQRTGPFRPAQLYSKKWG